MREVCMFNLYFKEWRIMESLQDIGLSIDMDPKEGLLDYGKNEALESPAIFHTYYELLEERKYDKAFSIDN